MLTLGRIPTASTWVRWAGWGLFPGFHSSMFVLVLWLTSAVAGRMLRDFPIKALSFIIFHPFLELFYWLGLAQLLPSEQGKWGVESSSSLLIFPESQNGLVALSPTPERPPISLSKKQIIFS